MTRAPSERPSLTIDLSGTELIRWYWLKDELTDFARRLGIRTTGGKELLSQRIASHLDGCAFTEPTTTKKSSARQLSGLLTPATMIPVGQRCSQVLRAWFAEEIGAHFRFDREMRELFSTTDGTQTLADAVDYWHQTRTKEPKPIDAQFEYNRFTRAWYDKFPHGTKDELLIAWHDYRSHPIDARGRA